MWKQENLGILNKGKPRDIKFSQEFKFWLVLMDYPNSCMTTQGKGLKD